MRWRRNRRDLVERLRPYWEQHRTLPEPMVDVDPIRMFIFRWMIETGDSIEVVARGFDADALLLGEILDRRVKSLSRRRAIDLCQKLGLFETNVYSDAASSPEDRPATNYGSGLYVVDSGES